MNENIKKNTLLEKLKNKFKTIGDFFCYKDVKVRLSMIFPGLGQLLHKQIIKGLLYISIFITGILYFIFMGGKAIVGFFTLGTKEGNAWLNISGDNSIIMMLMGILAFIILGFLVGVYLSSVKATYETSKMVALGKKPRTFYQDLKQLVNSKFHITVLFLPVIGVCVFNILPIVFMILIAFTNYGNNVVPPKLVDWIGFGNFAKIIVLSDFAPTFFKILSWNIIWAIAATALNYFGGLGIALLLNKKCVKGKVFWRAFPVLAYAVPGFISLIAFKFLFAIGGPMNQMIESFGGTSIGFLTKDSKWLARIIGLAVNAWITIPTSMLLATGILSNINTDLYEAAELDGASRWKIFIKITLPFVVFSTTPVIITQFIGNFNNFGVFHFLREKIESDGYFLANNTDLLINWLYKVSITNKYYSIGAAISLVIFIITSVIALVVYLRSPAYRKEDTFR